MTASHGSKATFGIGSTALPSTIQDISTYANSVGASFSRDVAEASTMGVTSKKYVTGLKDATIPFEGPFDPPGDAILWDVFNSGALISFNYKPSGPGTGNIQYTGVCLITSYEVSSDIGDVNAVSAEFQVSGDVVRTVL